jgi:hypothetical protein
MIIESTIRPLEQLKQASLSKDGLWRDNYTGRVAGYFSKPSVIIVHPDGREETISEGYTLPLNFKF